MSDTIPTVRGQTIDCQCTARQSGGAPVDLTGATLRIFNGAPAQIKDAAVTIVDAPAGRFRVFMGKSVVDRLVTGKKTNWFKVEIDFGTSNLLTPRIWISVDA